VRFKIMDGIAVGEKRGWGLALCKGIGTKSIVAGGAIFAQNWLMISSGTSLELPTGVQNWLMISSLVVPTGDVGQIFPFSCWLVGQSQQEGDAGLLECDRCNDAGCCHGGGIEGGASGGVAQATALTSGDPTSLHAMLPAVGVLPHKPGEPRTGETGTACNGAAFQASGAAAPLLRL